MSYSQHPRWRATTLRELLVAASWSLGLLVAGAWQQLAVFGELSSDWGALMQTMGVRFAGTPLMAQIAGFVAAVVLVHLLFGLACWALARCTRLAWPASRSREWTVLLAWLAAGTLWLLVANAAQFPWSETGLHGAWASWPLVGGVDLHDLVTIALSAAVVLSVLGALLQIPALRGRLPRIALYGALTLGAVALAWTLRPRPDAGGAAAQRPHIILIGIDSLRNDAIAARTGIGVTPYVDEFLRGGAHRFTHSSTPVARTFPAWVSILTGRLPRHTGAREDLVARGRLNSFDTLADQARRAGYHTVWAMDEVRFANIDESYGFDQRITPTIGIADFLLAKANDFPLTNVLADTWVAKWLFPATYGNRAAAHTYRPETFVEWLDADLSAERPTFLALHLTLPHHPYNWSAPTDQIFRRDTDTTYRYLNAVIAADRQFGDVMALLERKGMLDNALVVMLSDHGEALGVPSADSLLRGRTVLELLEGQRIALYGHGSSVLSPNQYATVLAIRGFGKAEFATPGRDHAEQVSLLDIAPTLADYLGLKPRDAFDGSSLRPIIEGDAAQAARLDQRVHFTETGFRTPLLDSGKIDEIGLMGQAAPFFRMDPVSTRLEVRPELMSRLLADKERAAFTRNLLLAAIPTGVDGKDHMYVLLNRHTGEARRLTAAPEPASDPEAAGVWAAFHGYYGPELLPPRP